MNDSYNIEFVSPGANPTRPIKRQQCSFPIQHVMPGETITTEMGFLRGHGTYIKDNQLIATVSGVVDRVNKLISVRPLKARYQGEVGDVIVGRIFEVGQKRWKVDVNSRQDAILQLSSINLPGGIQRRRTHSDERNMRSFFVENDLISAEVQQFFSDGAMSLHTRNLKYGKLANGQFVSVPPALMRRTKQAFVTLPCNIDVILGNNGYIWISQTATENQTNEEGNPIIMSISTEIREKICRVRNSILALATLFIAIYPTTIIDTYSASLEYQLHPKDMLKPHNLQQITRTANERKKSKEENKDDI